jgi:RNA polymerase sigma factor (sigma-70 family)
MDTRVGGVEWRSAEFSEAFRRGDVEILESIYWAHVKGVEHLLRVGFVGKNGSLVVPGVREPDRRADLLQEVFMKAFGDSARRRFDVGLEYAPYLWTICRNVLVDHHRGMRRDRAKVSQLPPPDVDLVLTQEPKEPEWAAPVLVELVDRYVAGLGPPLNDVYEMRFLTGRSQKVVAATLGISRQNVRTLETHLKQGLRRELQLARGSQDLVRQALDGRPEMLFVTETRGK